MKNEAFLALGSNMGNREGNLLSAVEAVGSIEAITLEKVSYIYETEPVGYTRQEKFLNMAIRIKTDLQPIQLLEEMQNIEVLLKRKREIRWGPRTIDIDILLYNDIHMDLPRLTIPHPRMYERAFVLIPLRDVYPYECIGQYSLDLLMGQCADRHGVRLFKSIRQA